MLRIQYEVEVSLLLGSRKVPGSKLDLENGYVHRFFIVYLVAPSKCWDSNLK